jgi:monomeric sarcosine oxidase
MNSQTRSGARVVVVGAGIMGSCTALSLALRNHRVTVLDQFAPPHLRGSSAGSSRIVRKAYPDELYTRIMLSGYELWRKWESHAGVPLLNETGLLFIGDANDAAIRSQLDALRSLQIPHRVQDATDRHEHVRDFVLGPDEVAISTADGGWVDPQRAIRAFLDAARRAGAEVVVQEVQDLESLQRDYDWVVLCCGPWIRRFVALDVVATLQWVAYLRGVRTGPVWIVEEPGHPYGFPSAPGSDVFKVALHTRGLPQDPDTPERPESAATIEAIRSVAKQRLGVTEPTVVHTESCLYTNTSDEDFRWGMPADRILFVSACSGHGFKFGPWVGEFVADVIGGSRSLDEFPRFRSRAGLQGSG